MKTLFYTVNNNNMVDAEETPLNQRISISFRHDIMKELMKSKFNNSKGKISDQAVELISEVAKAMVIEATARACYEANLENKTGVNLDHVESILPQMMLDFP